MKRTKLKLARIVAVTLLCAAAMSTAMSQETSRNTRGVDPLAAELRDQQPDDDARHGFDIGMGAADGHTLPGPGKDKICNSLPPAEQEGCRIAVSFSVQRNRNAQLYRSGARMWKADPVIAEARNASPDVFYRLGFDIASGIFGDPALGVGAQGNTATGPGSLGIRDSLSAAAQRGFDASMTINLNRRGVTTTSGQSQSKNKIEEGPKIGNTTPEPEPEYAEMRCRGYNFVGSGSFVFSTTGSRNSVTGETILTLEMAFNPALKAAGPDGSGLRIGECAFANRALTDREPYRVRFDTAADGQIRQRQHGSAIDNSPTAAERFPDAQNIPLYLKDPNHYWSFSVKNGGRGYFESSNNSFWKPSRSLSPDAIRTGPRIRP